MTGKLKDFFDETVVRSISASLKGALRGFDATAFVVDCLAGFPARELTGRGWHVAEMMQRHLPQPFAKAAPILLDYLGPELQRSDEFGLAPFRYMPHVFFVQKYGLDDFEPSMQLQYELTKRFSAESSIRSFLVQHPTATYSRLRKWARDPNVHVRRLVSEGTRPRLPWAPRLRAFQQDPAPVLVLLELLKDDPERYVQRSVANNLNDIGKDHPDIAAAVCRNWAIDAPPGRRWIVKHALRSLLKAGHRGALETLGVGSVAKVRVGGLKLTPRSVKVGEVLRFSFELESTAKREQELLVDYAVHFVKSNGATRAKVFKLRRLMLPPTSAVQLSSKVSFEALTTRRPHPGRHRIDLLINGVTHPLAEFDVRQ